MQNGFIIRLVSWLLELLNYISLVEYFKKIAVSFLPSPATISEQRLYSNIAIDVFVITKWLFLAFIWWRGYDGVIWIAIASYLIVTNIHTYFYYHFWKKPTTLDAQGTEQRAKRRLVNLILAVAFSNTTFAYLYGTCFHEEIKWTEDINAVVHAMQLSWGNALAGSFGGATPLTNNVVIFLTIQQALTFVFVAIILSKTTSE